MNWCRIPPSTICSDNAMCQRISNPIRQSIPKSHRSWVGKIFSKCFGRKNGLRLAASNAFLTLESSNGGAIDQQVQGTWRRGESSHHRHDTPEINTTERPGSRPGLVPKSRSYLNPILIFYQTLSNQLNIFKKFVANDIRIEYTS